MRGLEYLIHAGHTGDELAAQVRRLGYDPERLTGKTSQKVYAENARDDVSTALKGLLVKEALDYGLASMETAFVAVRSEPGKPLEESVIVANATPDWLVGSFPWRRCHDGGSSRRCVLSCRARFQPHLAHRPAGLMRSIGGFAAKADASLSAPVVAPETAAHVLFSGVPSFVAGEAVLFDSGLDAGGLPESATFERLDVRFPDGAPQATSLNGGLCLLVYVGDLAAPQARVRLADVVRQPATALELLADPARWSTWCWWIRPGSGAERCRIWRLRSPGSKAHSAREGVSSACRLG